VRAAEEALASARKQAEAAGRTRDGHAARLQALSELGERGEGAAAGARMLLDAGRRGHGRGALSLLVGPPPRPPGLANAAQAALGPYAAALLCDSREAAHAALAWLRTRKAAALILPGAPKGGAESLPGSLGTLVGGDGAAQAWISELLGGAILCDSLTQHP